MEQKTWWKESVVYQIYPRSFMDSNGDGIGDLNGIRQKLDYLTGLGIDVIWISPFFKSPNDDNGYDISDYRGIMDEFGTMDDFDALLADAHRKGLKIVMDLVVNHSSDEHPWFIESRKSRNNPYRDYYFWREGKNGNPPNNWGSWFSGPAWEYDKNTDMYFLHIFSKKQPDLNWDNPKVRDEIFDMMNWWCEKGIDGFRMDVISLISKVPGLPDGKKWPGALYGDAGPFISHGPHVHEYLKEMNKRVLSRYDIMTVGEAANVTIEEAKKYAGFDAGELNMVFQFEHMGTESAGGSKWTDRRFNLPALKGILSRWQTELEGKAWNSLYFENHDQPRSVSRFGNDTEYWEKSAKMLATCLHMQKGTPYIYQGEELGMTNTVFTSLDQCRDIETLNVYREKVEQEGVPHETMMRYISLVGRDNARTPMQWNGDKNAGFTEGTPWLAVNPNYKKINTASQINDPDSIYSYYKNLIRLRKTHPVIVYGTYELLEPENENLFIYTRTLEKTKILVICNFTSKEIPYNPPEEFAESGLLVSNSDNRVFSREMILSPYEASVYLI
ncbi:alpha-glucosidase [Brucepastera parasyntrophica]|uniref:glycoside hydrolase family 13 protein n=1 Tax=Brucepastera parasyntrophica TaxID=2880008 RepID=UPI0021090EF5|nr:alpha-glucosidase [Brucepastera parasyntrophica]ULQ60509.1 alpha-glucosidase [Brucepastera parasyntrophica]